jgi:hypothetical protein
MRALIRDARGVRRKEILQPERPRTRRGENNRKFLDVLRDPNIPGIGRLDVLLFASRVAHYAQQKIGPLHSGKPGLPRVRERSFEFVVSRFASGFDRRLQLLTRFGIAVAATGDNRKRSEKTGRL